MCPLVDPRHYEIALHTCLQFCLFSLLPVAVKTSSISRKAKSQIYCEIQTGLHPFLGLINRSPGNWDSDLEVYELSCGLDFLFSWSFHHCLLLFVSTFLDFEEFPLIWSDYISISLSPVGAVRWVFGETRNSVAYKAPSFELACIHKKRNLGSEGPQSRLLSLNPAHSLHCPSKFDRRRSLYLVSSDDLCISWKHVVLMDFVIGQLNVNSVYSIVDLTWTRSCFGNSELGSFPNWEHIVRV